MADLLRPTAPISADLILVSDPEVAMSIAVELIDGPLMANHAGGLWGYHGRVADGGELSVHSCGAGGASAALVVDQLAGLGVRRAVYLGVSDRLPPGEIVVPGWARCGDGTSAAIAGLRVKADQRMASQLAAALGLEVAGGVHSRDPFTPAATAVPGLVADDYESAAVLAVASRRQIGGACALVGPGEGSDPLGGQLARLGAAALAALSGRGSRTAAEAT